MNDGELAEQLFVFMEELYLRVVVQQALLDIWDPEDWRKRAEDAEILNSPRIRALFDKLRSELFEPPPENHPAMTWQEMVRQTLKQLPG